MVLQVRIDDRLIHGQVAIMWSKELDTQGIIVANDKAAANETMAATLRMGCPTSQKLLIKGIEDAARIINDPRGAEMRILVLVNRVTDALALVEACPGQVPVVNFANVGRFDGSDPASLAHVAKNVMLSASELEATKKLIATGVDAYNQPMPQDRRIPMAQAISELG